MSATVDTPGSLTRRFQERAETRANGAGMAGPPTTWKPVDLAPIVDGLRSGQIVGPVPSIMTRTDGVSLLYPGEVHSLAGEPETGKGWITLATCASVIDAGGLVLYLDFEDAPASIVSRLLALGADVDAIVDRFVYVRPADPFSPDVFYVLITERTFAMAVIDGVSEAYSLMGLDPYSNPDAAKFLTALPRPLAARGAAVLEIDHVVKSREARGRYALGAQHKLAGVGAAYSTDVVHAPSRTSDGLTRLKVEKDRHGHVRGHAQGDIVALVHIRPQDDGARVTVTLEPPDLTDDTSSFRPTALMEKTSRFLEAEPGANARAIRAGVQGNTRWATEALRILIAEEYVKREPDGSSQRHYSVRPYRQDTDRDHVTEPCAERDQNTPQRDRDHVTPPIGARVTEHTHPTPPNQRDRDHDADHELQRLELKYGDQLDNPEGSL